jgi:hypothetical protein
LKLNEKPQCVASMHFHDARTSIDLGFGLGVVCDDNDICSNKCVEREINVTIVMTMQEDGERVYVESVYLARAILIFKCLHF